MLLLRHMFLWFAFGFWALAAAAILAGNAWGSDMGRWSGDAGIVIGLTLLGPVEAALLGGLYVLWLAIRTTGRAIHGRFLVPLAAGLLNLPVAMIVLVPLVRLNLASQTVFAVVMFGTPVVLAEVSLLFVSLKARGDDQPPRPSSADQPHG